MHLNFEEAYREEIGVTLPNLAFLKLFAVYLPTPTLVPLETLLWGAGGIAGSAPLQVS